MPRGIQVHSDLSTTLDGISLNAIYTEYQRSIATYNTNRSKLVSLISYPTVGADDSVLLDPEGMDFEEASEFGAPTAGQAVLPSIKLGFPLQWFDLGLRYTRRFLRDATQADVDQQHVAALEAHNRLVYRQAFRALYTKVSSGSRRVNSDGTSIFSLYDGSADSKPPTHLGQTFDAGHSHYLVSGSATVDGQDVVEVVNHVAHHGYGQGSDQIVVLVHPDQSKTIQGLRRNETDSPYDFIPSAGAPYLTVEHLEGQAPPQSFNGLPIIGQYGSALIHETRYVPAGYIAALNVAGANSQRNALAFRQHPLAAQQGLLLVPDSDSYPLINATYETGFGFGVRNRGAAAVMQIKASGSYVSPTF